MKLCKDCKHCSYFNGIYYCERNKDNVPKYQNPVTGNISPSYKNTGITYAPEERKAWFFGCGKNAKYWGPK